jgi:hypothetical protein
MPQSIHSTPLFCAYQDALIVLPYDSTLSENETLPFRRGQDYQDNYNFTVEQRSLAKRAKTALSLEELETTVSFFWRNILVLILSHS